MDISGEAAGCSHRLCPGGLTLAGERSQGGDGAGDRRQQVDAKNKTERMLVRCLINLNFILKIPESGGDMKCPAPSQDDSATACRVD